MRRLGGWQATIVGGWLICASLFQIYTGGFGVFEPRLQRAIHVAFLLPVAFLLFPATKKSPKDRITITDAILAILALVPVIFIAIESERLYHRFEFVTPVTNIETAFGLLNVLLLLEAVRRAVVPAMAALAAVSILYCFAGPYLPGLLHCRFLPFDRVIEMQYLLQDQGIYGTITGLSATFIALFIIFGAFIYVCGVGDFFTDLACKLAGKTKGGPAKIAVISSGFFGSISGVAAANVLATGTFTIPLMKRLGYRKQFAGAVEAAASTGGLIMPPVMGAGAFVMAEITKIPYIKICGAAVIGAVLYFLSVGLMVHFQAVKQGLRGIDMKEVPPLRSILRNAYLLTPIIGLVYLLVIGYSPFMAAFVSILLALVTSFFRRKTMMTPRRILAALEMGGRNMVTVALACVGAGLIISVLVNTGLALALSSVVISWSRGIFIFALFLVMVSSIVLGMGLPCTPAYIIAVSVGGPVLIAMGTDLLAAHMFVFYFAILAAVTPPVAIAAYAAAAVAGSDPIKTGFTALRLAVAGFIIPYVFVYNPALLLMGSVLEIFTSSLLLIATVILFAAGLTGCLIEKINILQRALLLGAGAALVVFNVYFSAGLNLVVLAGTVSIIIALIVRRKRKCKSSTLQ